ncbi:immunoglobulin superfamily member 11 isoform X2 [Erpetoichthys calabaricus]|uniref:immunoglobulin superfamily member 11 isoform X2 n=1 Tax=Erpetoichthys calabaricus TaxID=27687 RepID=UPI002234DAB1|nr:immunoglobulin superfamily member 11 isoform X2 [Erpetoichthys calabaricus]
MLGLPGKGVASTSMDVFQALVSLVTCLHYCTLHKVVCLQVRVERTNVEVQHGEAVLLPCSFVTTAVPSRLNIIWTTTPLSEPSSPSQVIVYDQGQAIESPTLTGRVRFVSAPLSADILLNMTRLSDAGKYRCVVSNPPESGSPGIAELSLTVLAPPSSPHCFVSGNMDEGGSISLTCFVEYGVPVPDLNWSKIKPDKIFLPVNMEDSLRGTVQIFNVSSQTSGLYQCTVSNRLGTEICSVELIIHSTPHGTSGILQSIFVTLTMALILLTLLALVLWLHRSGYDRTNRSGQREEEEPCYNEIRYRSNLLRRSFV